MRCTAAYTRGTYLCHMGGGSVPLVLMFRDISTLPVLILLRIDYSVQTLVVSFVVHTETCTAMLHTKTSQVTVVRSNPKSCGALVSTHRLV